MPPSGLRSFFNIINRLYFNSPKSICGNLWQKNTPTKKCRGGEKNIGKDLSGHEECAILSGQRFCAAHNFQNLIGNCSLTSLIVGYFQ